MYRRALVVDDVAGKGIKEAFLESDPPGWLEYKLKVKFCTTHKNFTKTGHSYKTMRGTLDNWVSFGVKYECS